MLSNHARIEPKIDLTTISLRHLSPESRTRGSQIVALGTDLSEIAGRLSLFPDVFSVMFSPDSNEHKESV
jgi:hypothetical protein